MGLVGLSLGKRKIIVNKLKELGATKEENAKSLKEIGLSDDKMLKLVQKLINDKILLKTKDNKYYINK